MALGPAVGETGVTLPTAVFWSLAGVLLGLIFTVAWFASGQQKNGEYLSKDLVALQLTVHDQRAEQVATNGSIYAEINLLKLEVTKSNEQLRGIAAAVGAIPQKR